MALFNKTELLNKLSEIFGDSTDDKILALYDYIDDISEEEQEDWERKYKENDNMWRQRYRERFFTTGEEIKEDQEEDVKDDGEEVTFEDLFEEREG